MKTSIPPHKINAILKSKGLTDSWLAKEVGTTRQHMGRLLNGKTTLTMEWVLKISKALKIKPNQLASVHLSKKLGTGVDHALIGSIIGWLLEASSQSKVRLSKKQLGKLSSLIYQEAVEQPLSFDHARQLAIFTVKVFHV